MSMFEEEKKHLEIVLKKINIEIEKSKKQLKELSKQGTSLSFEDRKRGEHFNINSIADNVDKKIGILTRAIPNPYFGRMDISFSSDKKNFQKMYIGRSGISADRESIITDWRAPISSLYYDSELGDIEYRAPEGMIKCYMNLKRQINIKNSELIDVQDSSLVTNDELLRPYLSTNADNKMKTIIASIQKEQNSIIRKSPSSNIIVQGVAGSGKTSVALHRIAYLIYELAPNISSEQFLVLGPNDYFLNYISSILPELETSPVTQETLLNFTREYINEKINLKFENEIFKEKKYIENYKNIQTFKTSIEYKELIDRFMYVFLDKYIVEKDFIIDNEIIFTKEEIKKLLYTLDAKKPNFDKAYQLLTHNLNNNLQEIYERVNKKYKAIYTKLPFDSIERKEYVEKSVSLYENLKNNGRKLIKKYINEIQKKPIDIYKMFISKIDTYSLPITEKELLLLQKETLIDLKKKKIGFEDIPALIHINYIYSNKKLNYKHLIIDEAQDYGIFHFMALKEINPDSTFAIYGDLAQSIYSYRSIKSWESVNREIFNNNCEIIKLDKSYRTTIEITNNANIILRNIGLNEAQPVIRNGPPVEYSNNSNSIDYKVEIINKLLQEGYKTIAIICKKEDEAKKINKLLLSYNVDSKYISNKDVEYEGGVFVLTSSAAKGLEFDAVIINDASNNIYSDDSDVDMHLLYVASTRALHKLIILYNNKIVNAYNDSIKKDNNDSTKKLKKAKKYNY